MFRKLVSIWAPLGHTAQPAAPGETEHSGLSGTALPRQVCGDFAAAGQLCADDVVVSVYQLQPQVFKWETRGPSAVLFQGSVHVILGVPDEEDGPGGLRFVVVQPGHTPVL